MQTFWQKKYAQMDYLYGTEPNAFLVAEVSRIPPQAKVLVIGDGEGRNGVWLARQGFQVTSIDYSTTGVEKAQQLAKKYQVTYDIICADLIQDATWKQGIFDVLVWIYVHFPAHEKSFVFEKASSALKPQGILLMEVFHKKQINYGSGGPPDTDLLYSVEELKQGFLGFNIVLLEEKIIKLEEGKGHIGEGCVIRMIAEKMEPHDVI